MDTDNAASLQSIDANIVKYQGLVAVEDDKMLRYKVENVRRKHNYLPLIVEILKVLGQEGKLVALVEKVCHNSNHLWDQRLHTQPYELCLCWAMLLQQIVMCALSLLFLSVSQKL